MFGLHSLEMRTTPLMTISMLVMVVINVVEQPYTRSLTVCDEPRNASSDEFSGSMNCGNRLYVIEYGARVFGTGQALENVGRIMVTVLVSSLSSHGRKIATVMSHAFSVFSLALFIAISFVPASWSMALYTIAQVFQGMSGMGILMEIVAGDVAQILEDPLGVYNRKGTMGAIFGILSAFVVGAVLKLELTDYTIFWSVLMAISAADLALLIAVFPETVPESAKAKEPPRPIADVAAEVKLYATYMNEDSFMRNSALGALFFCLANFGDSIGAAATMAFFGVSHFDCLLYFLPTILLSPVFMPLLQAVGKRYTHQFAWELGFWYDKVIMVIMTFFYFTAPFGVPMGMLAQIFRVVNSGYGNLEGVWRLELTGEKNHPKFQGILQLVVLLGNGLSSWMYPNLFHPQAETMLGKAPFLPLSLVFYLLSGALCYWGTGAAIRSVLDKLDEDLKKKAAAAPEEEKKEK